MRLLVAVQQVSRFAPLLTNTASFGKLYKNWHKMWRTVGGAMQPMLGTVSSLIGALKPAPTKVTLPTGEFRVNVAFCNQKCL